LPSLCADWEGAGGIGASGQGGTSSKSFSDISASVGSIIHAGDTLLLEGYVYIYLKEDPQFRDRRVRFAVAMHKNIFRKALFSKHKHNLY